MDELDLGSTIKGFIAGQKVFKRYTLKRILGRGGMGVVWLARDEELEREVALKFLPEVVALDPEAVADLKRETRRNLDLTHTNIVRIYDFVSDGRTAAISMEYVDGASLNALKLERPGRAFAVDELRPWLTELLDALHYAHTRAKIVHRDLKPANLMITQAGELKITDFGIARGISDSVSRVSAQAGSSGTPVYMSPQQMMGEKPAVTDDLYALGATLYELLTGKPPFFSGNVILQVQNKVPPSLAERRRELELPETPIPPAWEDAVAACLAKDAAARPQSIADLKDRLAGANPPPTPVTQPESKPPAATPAAAPAPVTKTKGTARWVLMAVAILVLLGGAGGWYFGQHVPAMRQDEALAASKTDLEQGRSAFAAASARKDFAAAATLLAQLQRDATVQPVEARAGWNEFLGEAESRLAAAKEDDRLASLRIPVTLRSQPAGAEVFVDGERRGVTPLSELNLPLGRHQVRLRLADHEEFSTAVEVTETGPTEWQWPLVHSRGTLRLTGQPAGAAYKIYLGDPIGGFESAAGASGSLPADALQLPVGRHLVTLERTDLPPDRRIKDEAAIEVRRNETTSLALDVRGGVVRIDSTPAGATVWVDGQEQGRTPWVRRDLPKNQVLNVELKLAGHDSQSRSFTIGRFDEPQVWNPVLAARPELELKADFRHGPRRVTVRAKAQTSTTSRTTTQGKTTTNDATPASNMVLVTTYEMLALDGAGLWRQVRSEPRHESAEAMTFKPGTVVQFDRIGSHWQASFVRGGFKVEGLGPELLSPGNPVMWLNADVLPTGPAEPGRTWDVPMRAAGLLFPGFQSSAPTGFIRGRVVSADPNPTDGWAELAFDFDLSGTMDRAYKALPDTYHSVMTGRHTGRLTMRVELARGYVSRAHMESRSDVTNSMTPITKSGRGGSSLAGLVGQAIASNAITAHVISESVVELVVEPETPSGAAPGATISTPGPRIFEQAEVDKPPAFSAGQPPAYPAKMRRAGIEATVRVRLEQDAEGRVTRVEALDSPDESFTQAINEAVPAWRFRPAEKDGRAVPVRVIVPVKFQLEG